MQDLGQIAVSATPANMRGSPSPPVVCQARTPVALLRLGSSWTFGMTGM
jgi:hypothetical protein